MMIGMLTVITIINITTSTLYFIAVTRRPWPAKCHIVQADLDKEGISLLITNTNDTVSS